MCLLECWVQHLTPAKVPSKMLYRRPLVCKWLYPVVCKWLHQVRASRHHSLVCRLSVLVSSCHTEAVFTDLGWMRHFSMWSGLTVNFPRWTLTADTTGLPSLFPKLTIMTTSRTQIEPWSPQASRNHPHKRNDGLVQCPRHSPKHELGISLLFMALALLERSPSSFPT